tara:strand:- start:222 stop:1028 length:807 start_codon:yes stop_codon:yes gene_type:complete
MWKRLLRFSYPIAITNFLLIGYTRGDFLILDWMKDAESVGIYSAAIRLTGSLQIFPMAITTSLLPIISYKFISSEKERIEDIYKGIFSILLVFGMFIGLSITFVSSEIIDLTYGSQYKGAFLPLQISGWTQFCSFLLYLLTTMIIGMGYEKYFMFYGASLFTLKIILNIILIPDYDYIGVSISSLITEFILLVVLILFLSKKVAYPCIKSIVVVVFSTLLAWLISSYVTDVSYLQLLLGFFVYFSLVLVFGGITPAGLNSVQRLLKWN